MTSDDFGRITSITQVIFSPSFEGVSTMDAGFRPPIAFLAAARISTGISTDSSELQQSPVSVTATLWVSPPAAILVMTEIGSPTADRSAMKSRRRLSDKDRFSFLVSRFSFLVIRS
jgi:hypothetical protein